MKTSGLFGIIFLLFWAIPFPMLMYYHLSVFGAGSSPVMALIWLAVSVVLSILLLYIIFKRLVLGRFAAIRRLNNLMQNGELINARILQSVLLVPEFPGINKYQLQLEMQNFAGTTIRETVNTNDSNPVLHRFEAGKTVKLRIDKSLKNIPYLQIDGAHYNGPKARGLVLSLLIWMICAAVVGWYYIYSYQHENNGTGWRFMVWDHPLVLCPLIMLGTTALLRGGTLTQNQLQHKYYGYETQAQVTSAAQTGVYINNQPQVQFNLQYTDRKGRPYAVSFKKTLDLLNLNMAQQKTLDIFYLENDPQNICLASELNT